MVTRFTDREAELRKQEKILQISIPRGGSNAVARMFAQSPHVSSVLRSRMLEKGSQGFLEDLQNLVQQDKRHPLVKEMAAVITDERFTVFSSKDHYIFAIRNPVEQVWSLLCGIVQHSEAFRSFVLRTPECESIYHKHTKSDS